MVLLYHCLYLFLVLLTVYHCHRHNNNRHPRRHSYIHAHDDSLYKRRKNIVSVMV